MAQTRNCSKNCEGKRFVICNIITHDGPLFDIDKIYIFFNFQVKGPRISSLTFRSDLSWGSAYSDLCHSLASQRSNKNEIDDTKSFANEVAMDDIGEGALSEILIPSANADHVLEKETLLDVTGKGNGVFISKDTIVVLMAVANETNSTIVLSNRAGAVGGFESSPMPTVKVSSGVSVKIPVVIPRIDCLDEKGDVMDIANELIAHTALKWESEVVSNADSMQKGIRQGRVRIPSRCLREMIQEHNSFATRICKPPVDINFGVNGIIGNDSALSVSAGMPLDVSVYARVHGKRIITIFQISLLGDLMIRINLTSLLKQNGSQQKPSTVVKRHLNSAAQEKNQGSIQQFSPRKIKELSFGVDSCKNLSVLTALI